MGGTTKLKYHLDAYESMHSWGYKFVLVVESWSEYSYILNVPPDYQNGTDCHALCAGLCRQSQFSGFKWNLHIVRSHDLLDFIIWEVKPSYTQAYSALCLRITSGSALGTIWDSRNLIGISSVQGKCSNPSLYYLSSPRQHSWINWMQSISIVLFWQMKLEFSEEEI